MFPHLRNVIASGRSVFPSGTPPANKDGRFPRVFGQRTFVFKGRFEKDYSSGKMDEPGHLRKTLGKAALEKCKMQHLQLSTLQTLSLYSSKTVNDTLLLVTHPRITQSLQSPLPDPPASSSPAMPSCGTLEA